MIRSLTTTGTVRVAFEACFVDIHVSRMVFVCTVHTYGCMHAYACIHVIACIVELPLPARTTAAHPVTLICEQTDLRDRTEEASDGSDMFPVLMMLSMYGGVPLPKTPAPDGPHIDPLRITVKLSYMGDHFKRIFRLPKPVFHRVLRRVENLISPRNPFPGGRASAEAEVKLGLFLMQMSHTMVHHLVGEMGGHSASSAYRWGVQVADALIHAYPACISFPLINELDARRTIREGFANVGTHLDGDVIAHGGFDFAVGSLDATFIGLQSAPAVENTVPYVNRKGVFSVIAQMTCDARMLITSLFSGIAGSAHDSFVMERSPLNYHAQHSGLFADGTYLLADAGYRATSWTLTPFHHTGALTDQQQRFNLLHSRARTVIERMFGALKGRFRSLRSMRGDVRNVPKFVQACCVLHNQIVLANLQVDDLNDIPVDGLDDIPDPDTLDDVVAPPLFAPGGLDATAPDPSGAALRLRLLAELIPA